MTGKYDTSVAVAELVCKLPPDEPWFFFRAQDRLAPQAVRRYAALLDNADLTQQAAECRKIAKEMDAWQKANPDKVGDPD